MVAGERAVGEAVGVQRQRHVGSERAAVALATFEHARRFRHREDRVAEHGERHCAGVARGRPAPGEHRRTVAAHGCEHLLRVGRAEGHDGAVEHAPERRDPVVRACFTGVKAASATHTEPLRRRLGSDACSKA